MYSHENPLIRFGIGGIFHVLVNKPYSVASFEQRL